MNIELRELKYFITVAKLGTLTKAADALFVSQPALTKTIKKLESNIGAPLFQREKNQLFITDIGQELFNKAQSLINDYEDLWIYIDDVKNVERGRISIGLPPCTIPLLFHNTFLQYKSEHPNVSIHFTDNGREEVVKGLLSGDLDLGFMVQDSPSEGIEEIPLFTSDMVAVVRDSHKLSSCPSIEIETLKEYPLCILQENYLMAQQMIIKCHQAGFTPNISCSNSNCDFLIKLSQSSDQVAIVPRAIFLEKQYDGMKAVPFSNGWPWILCMGWKKDNYMSYATKKLRAKIVEQFL